MATLTEQRVASGGAEAAANTLKSEAVQDSVADVITDAMAVWLEVDPEDEEEAEAIAEIALRAGAERWEGGGRSFGRCFGVEQW